MGTRRELRSRRAAREFADAWLARQFAEELVPGTQVTALAYLEHFLVTHVVLYRPTSRRLYRGIIHGHLVPAFCSRRLAAIDVASIQTLIAALAPRLARATIGKIRDVLLQVLRQAIRDGFAACRIHARDVRLPSRATAKLDPRAYVVAELLALIEASPWPWRALWAVLGFAGLRISEALGLCWSHVDLERGSIRLRQNCVEGVFGALKTEKSRADVPILAPLAAILTAYQRAWQHNDRGLLFATSRGTPLRADHVRRRVLAPLLVRLGLQHGATHGFRHGLPQLLIARGFSQTSASRFLRHADVAMTERYTHLSDAEFAATVQASAARFDDLCKTPQPGAKGGRGNAAAAEKPLLQKSSAPVRSCTTPAAKARRSGSCGEPPASGRLVHRRINRYGPAPGPSAPGSGSDGCGGAGGAGR